MTTEACSHLTSLVWVCVLWLPWKLNGAICAMLFTMLVSHVLTPIAGGELICVVIWPVGMNTYILLSWSCLLAWAVQESALVHIRSPSLDDWLVRPLGHSHNTWLYLKQHPYKLLCAWIYVTSELAGRKFWYLCNQWKLYKMSITLCCIMLHMVLHIKFAITQHSTWKYYVTISYHIFMCATRIQHVKG